MDRMDGVAVIAGAGSGIGKGTGWTFAARGASAVVFADLNLKAAEQASEESKKHATHPKYSTLAVEVDVANRQSVDALVAAAVEKYGRIDYYINSAGLGPQSDKPILECDVEEFDKLHSINVKGILHSVAAVASQMTKQEEKFVEGFSGRRSVGKGCMVMVTSICSYLPVPTHVQYIASKFGGMGIIKTAAMELGRSSIRINGCCPSWVDTPLMEKNISRVPATDDFIKKSSPLGRMAVVEEISGVIHFLCSPDASYINGQGIIPDAGLALSAVF